jgi:polysaccharide pyruvyl transferase WcaK-like protein
MPDLRGALGWRYREHVVPALDLHGSLPLFIARKLRNRRLLGRSNVVYLYAGRGNAGDYLSHLGVRSIVGLPGLELLAGQPGNRELSKALVGSRFRARYRVLVIGGGGLFQECFGEFWQVILASGLPYAIVGVGANRLGDQRSITDAGLLETIVRRAAFIYVRDTMTRETIAKCGVREEVPVGLCPATSALFPGHWREESRSGNVLLHVVHPSDLRMAHGDLDRARESARAIARELELSYVEEDNMSADVEAVLKRYRTARVVLSSRLHGCIISYATGIPFVPLRCDEKIEAFLHTHCPAIKAVEIEALHRREALRDVIRATLNASTSDNRDYLEREVRRNTERGEWIRRQIMTKAWQAAS